MTSRRTAPSPLHWFLSLVLALGLGWFAGTTMAGESTSPQPAPRRTTAAQNSVHNAVAATPAPAYCEKRLAQCSDGLDLLYEALAEARAAQGCSPEDAPRQAAALAQRAPQTSGFGNAAAPAADSQAPEPPAVASAPSQPRPRIGRRRQVVDRLPTPSYSGMEPGEVSDTLRRMLTADHDE